MSICQYLIILHGWQSSKEKWQMVKENLEGPGLKVIVPDLPGFKPENQLSKPWDLDDYVNWLLKLTGISHRLAQPFFLLGHSFGGSIAIKFAAKHPEKLKGLILCSSAGIREKEKVKKAFIKLTARVGKTIFSLPLIKRAYPCCQRIFYEKILRKTDYLRARGVMKETFKRVVSEDLANYLSLIKTPTLIIWGSKDKITPLSHAYLMKERIKNCQLEILEGVKHCPHLESPQLLVEKVREFLC